MMRWSLLGTQEPEELLTQCFTYFLEVALDLGLVWEAGRANGAAVWIAPGSCERNLSIYTNCGFRVVHHADAPDGGPHVWFMRWEP
jgi:hypothetical protein